MTENGSAETGGVEIHEKDTISNTTTRPPAKKSRKRKLPVYVAPESPYDAGIPPFESSTAVVAYHNGSSSGMNLGSPRRSNRAGSQVSTDGDLSLCGLSRSSETNTGGAAAEEEYSGNGGVSDQYQEETKPSQRQLQPYQQQQPEERTHAAYSVADHHNGTDSIAAGTDMVRGIALEKEDEVVELPEESMLAMASSFLQTLATGPQTGAQVLEAVTRDMREWQMVRSAAADSQGGMSSMGDIPSELRVMIDVMMAVGLVRTDTSESTAANSTEELHPLVLGEDGSVQPRPCLCAQVTSQASEVVGRPFIAGARRAVEEAAGTDAGDGYAMAEAEVDEKVPGGSAPTDPNASVSLSEDAGGVVAGQHTGYEYVSHAHGGGGEEMNAHSTFSSMNGADMNVPSSLPTSAAAAATGALTLTSSSLRPLSITATSSTESIIGSGTITSGTGGSNTLDVSVVRFDAITSPTVAVRSVPRPARPLRPPSPPPAAALPQSPSSSANTMAIHSSSHQASGQATESFSPSRPASMSSPVLAPAADLVGQSGTGGGSNDYGEGNHAAARMSHVSEPMEVEPPAPRKGVFLSWAERTKQSDEFVTFLRSSVGTNEHLTVLGGRREGHHDGVEGGAGGPEAVPDVMPIQAQRMAEEGLFDEVEAVWGEHMIHLACAHVRSITQQTALNGGIGGVTFKRPENGVIVPEEEEIAGKYGRDMCETLLGWMQRRSGDWHVWKKGEGMVATEEVKTSSSTSNATASLAAAAAAAAANAIPRSSSNLSSSKKVTRYRLDPAQDECLLDWEANARRLNKLQVETARLSLREETMLRELFKRCGVPLPPGYTRAGCLQVLKAGHDSTGLMNRDIKDFRDVASGAGGYGAGNVTGGFLMRKASGLFRGKGASQFLAKKGGVGVGGSGGDDDDGGDGAAAGGLDKGEEEGCEDKEEGTTKGFSKNMTADALVAKALSKELGGSVSHLGDTAASSTAAPTASSLTSLSNLDGDGCVISDDGGAGVMAAAYGGEGEEGAAEMAMLGFDDANWSNQIVARHDVPPLQSGISYTSWSGGKQRKNSRSDSVSGWKDWVSPTGSLGARTPRGGAFGLGGGSFSGSFNYGSAGGLSGGAGTGTAAANNGGASNGGAGGVGGGSCNGGSGAGNGGGGGGGGTTPRNSLTPRNGSRDFGCSKEGWSSSGFPCPPDVADGDGKWGISGVADCRHLSKRVLWEDVVEHFQTISSTANLYAGLTGGGGGGHSLASPSSQGEGGLNAPILTQRSSSSGSLSRTLSSVSNDNNDMECDDASSVGDDSDMVQRRRNSSVCSLPCGQIYPSGPVPTAPLARDIVAPSFRLINDYNLRSARGGSRDDDGTGSGSGFSTDGGAVGKEGNDVDIDGGDGDKDEGNTYSDESSGEEDISDETILRVHMMHLARMKEKLQAVKAAKEARVLASPRYCSSKKKAKLAGSGGSSAGSGAGGPTRKGTKSKASPAGAATGFATVSSAGASMKRGRPKYTTVNLGSPTSPPGTYYLPPPPLPAEGFLSASVHASAAADAESMSTSTSTDGE